MWKTVSREISQRAITRKMSWRMITRRTVISRRMRTIVRTIARRARPTIMRGMRLFGQMMKKIIWIPSWRPADVSQRKRSACSWN